MYDRQSGMRETQSIILEVVALFCVLGGCTSNPVAEAREVAPGIYSISFAAKADDEAVRKAAEYCRAKGQNFSIEYGGDPQSEILFRCVASGEVAPADSVRP
jgi:hypothetical protein